MYVELDEDGCLGISFCMCLCTHTAFSVCLRTRLPMDGLFVSPFVQDEEVVVDDEEISAALARNEEELAMFRKMDKEKKIRLETKAKTAASTASSSSSTPLVSPKPSKAFSFANSTSRSRSSQSSSFSSSSPPPSPDASPGKSLSPSPSAVVKKVDDMDMAPQWVVDWLEHGNRSTNESETWVKVPPHMSLQARADEDKARLFAEEQGLGLESIYSGSRGIDKDSILDEGSTRRRTHDDKKYKDDFSDDEYLYDSDEQATRSRRKEKKKGGNEAEAHGGVHGTASSSVSSSSSSSSNLASASKLKLTFGSTSNAKSGKKKSTSSSAAGKATPQQGGRHGKRKHSALTPDHSHAAADEGTDDNADMMGDDDSLQTRPRPLLDLSQYTSVVFTLDKAVVGKASLRR